jgi:hypothetical protein
VAKFARWRKGCMGLRGVISERRSLISTEQLAACLPSPNPADSAVIPRATVTLGEMPDNAGPLTSEMEQRNGASSREKHGLPSGSQWSAWACCAQATWARDQVVRGWAEGEEPAHLVVSFSFIYFSLFVYYFPFPNSIWFQNQLRCYYEY